MGGLCIRFHICGGFCMRFHICGEVKCIRFHLCGRFVYVIFMWFIFAGNVSYC